MKSLFILLVACIASLNSFAQEKSSTVSTFIPINAQRAKLAHLRTRSDDVAALIKARQFDLAGQRAAELRKAYEQAFDKRLTQYSFQSQADFEEFGKSTNVKFEWIDWGYKLCLQMQAFIAVEKKDYAAALSLLSALETIAPVSAATAAETGYIYNHLGKPQEGLSAYRRALAISVKYASQQPYRAAALRGVGFALIDLQQLDEAERTFRESLDIEPGNAVALNELAYIHDQRGVK